jgi:hypothetical protein
MKNTQQGLVIEDINYCATVWDDTETIRGGGLWSAIKDTFKAKDRALGQVVDGGGLPTKQTVIEVITPFKVGVIRRWLF